MSITVSNVVATQGTGTYAKESVLEVTFTIAADGGNTGHTFTADAQISLSGSHSPYTGGSWVLG